MTCLFAAAGLVVATCLMLLSVHFRKRVRDNQKELHMNLEDCKIYFKMNRVLGFVFVSLRACGDFFNIPPPIISCVLMDDGKKVMSIPSFWLNDNGIARIKSKDTKNLVLKVTIYHKTTKTSFDWDLND